MRLVDDLISRLETRQMSVAGLQCSWCSACLRVGTRDPAIKGGSFELLHTGSDECRQQLHFGTISECIADLRAAATIAGGDKK